MFANLLQLGFMPSNYLQMDLSFAFVATLCQMVREYVSPQMCVLLSIKAFW